MTDTAAAPALEQPTPAQTTPTPPPAPAPMTREAATAFVLAKQEESYEKADYEERLAVLKRRSENGQPWNNPLFGTYNPSIEYTHEELKALITLDRDKLNYAWVNEKKNTCGKFAKKRHGLLCIPKQRGRRKPHLTPQQQAIKSESLRIFRSLLEERAEKLQAICKEEKLEYLGVPESAFAELGAKAAKLGMQAVQDKRRRKASKARRRQEHSRKVNAGLITISTSEKRYVNRGGEYGSK